MCLAFDKQNLPSFKKRKQKLYNILKKKLKEFALEKSIVSMDWC